MGFIKEKKKVNKKVTTLSTKKTRPRPRKKELAQENTHSTKKASTKKRTRSRKNDNGQESVQETTFPVKKIKKKIQAVLIDRILQSC